MDFTAAGTDHRRRVAEAARKRLAVLDHATHYTSTTYAAEPRVVDHGHGGDHGHGAGSWQKTNVVDRPSGLAWRCRIAPSGTRLPGRRSTAGVASARRGAGSYASMYEERLARTRRAFPGTGPKPKPRVGREVETKLGEVSAPSAPSWATPASDGKTRRPRASSRRARLARPRPGRDRSPRRPQTYARGGGRPRRRRARRRVARAPRTQPRAVSTTRRSAHPATGVR